MIRYTISGSRKNTFSTYGQEILKSRKTLESTLKEKNGRWMKYVLAVAEVKAKGEDLSITELKKFFSEAKLNGLNGEVALNLKKMKHINFYLNSLLPKEAQKFIEKSLSKN